MIIGYMKIYDFNPIFFRYKIEKAETLQFFYWDKFMSAIWIIKT